MVSKKARRKKQRNQARLRKQSQRVRESKPPSERMTPECLGRRSAYSPDPLDPRAGYWFGIATQRGLLTDLQHDACEAYQRAYPLLSLAAASPPRTARGVHAIPSAASSPVTPEALASHWQHWRGIELELQRVHGAAVWADFQALVLDNQRPDWLLLVQEQREIAGSLEAEALDAKRRRLTAMLDDLSAIVRNRRQARRVA